MATIEDIIANSLTYAEVVAPATPASGQVVVYAKADGMLYIKDDTGKESVLGGMSNPFTTQGDVLVQGAVNPERMALGSPNQLFIVNAGGTAPEWRSVSLARGICFSASNLADIDTTLVIPIVAPFPMVITGGKLQVIDAPEGAAIICDIHKNGVSLWTNQANRPRIADGANSGTITVPDVVNVAQGDWLLLYFDQVGVITKGKGFSLSLYGGWSSWL